MVRKVSTSTMREYGSFPFGNGTGKPTLVRGHLPLKFQWITHTKRLSASSFSGRRTKMYWYNPTTRTSERVQAPSTDQEAIQMLAGTEDSAQFIKHYCELRRSGTPLEQALVLVGHEVRLRQLEYRLALR